MKSSRLWSAALGCSLIVGCAAGPPAGPDETATCDSMPRREHWLGPKGGLGEPTFSELLLSFGAANLQKDADKTLYWYLWSQNYNRYRAVLEANGDIAPLKQQAAQEIQAGATLLACKRFIAETSIELLPYDAARSAFPVNARFYDEFDKPQTILNLNGQYGFRSAQIRMSREGWILPADQEQAQQLGQALGPVGFALAKPPHFHGVAVYTLDRCDPDPKQAEVLQCIGTLQKLFAFADPPLQPLYELVKGTQ